MLIPVYKEQFHDHGCRFKPNKYAQQTIITELDRMNDSYNWVVDIDSEEFFDTVNHDKLMTLMGKTIKDGEIILIIRRVPASGIKGDDEYRESVIGTRQRGNLLPLLVSIMWNELDKEVEQRELDFVRYADGCINVVGSEMSVKRVMRDITRFIEEKLGLKVSTTESKVDKPQEIEYLRYGFYFDSRAHQYKARPHVKSAAKFKARMKQLTCRSQGVSNIYKVQKLGELTKGWINYYKIGSMKPTCTRLDRNIQYRMHMYIWKRWRTPQSRARNLKKLSVPEWAARRTAYARGYTKVCRASDVCKVIDDKRLTSFGLISVLDYYTERCAAC